MNLYDAKEHLNKKGYFFLKSFFSEEKLINISNIANSIVEKSKKENVSLASTLDFAFKSYIAGCVWAFNQMGKKKVIEECRVNANLYMKEMESIIFSKE